MGAHKTISGVPPGPFTCYRPRCSHDLRNWAEIQCMESQEERPRIPSQGGEGTASFQKILKKLEHIETSVRHLLPHTGMCRGRQEGECREGVTTDSFMGCPTGKGGRAQLWAHSIDFSFPQGPSSNPGSLLTEPSLRKSLSRSGPQFLLLLYSHSFIEI